MTHSKLFIQMSGAPGSGKSTLARLLRPHVKGVVIDHDVLRSSLLETDSNIAFDDAAKSAYGLQWKLAEDMMKQGFSIIIDSTCNFPKVLEQGAVLAARYGYTYWYVECSISNLDLLDQRLRARREPMLSQRSAIDRPPAAARATRAGEDSHALFTKWTRSPCRPTENAIVVDAAADKEVLRDQVLAEMKVTRK